MINKKALLPRFLSNRYNIWKSNSYLQNEKNIKKLAKLGQKPQAMIISCCDSRVNVASIFGAKEGDLFIHRNIANIIPPCITIVLGLFFSKKDSIWKTDRILFLCNLMELLSLP